MKKLIILLLCLMFLSSCSRVPLFQDDEKGNLTDPETGINYVYCLGYLRAMEIHDEPYARSKYYGSRKMDTIHEIPGVDPEKWLSENLNEMSVAFLFRAENVEEPTLENFDTSKIYILQPGETTNFIIGQITDEEQVQIIVSDYLYGDDAAMPSEVDESFLFYFEFPHFPGIYYVLNYYVGSNGKEYLYCIWNERCVLLSINLW